MLNIRPATPNDIPEILQLIRELAEYEMLADQVVVTAEDLSRDGFSKQPYLHVLIAEWEGEPAKAAWPVIASPLGFENIQHGHRSSTGDHLGHDTVPFLHGEALNLDLPQTQQHRCNLRFLELQSPGFGLGPGDLLFRFKLHAPERVLCLEGSLDRCHLCLDGLLEGP